MWLTGQPVQQTAVISTEMAHVGSALSRCLGSSQFPCLIEQAGGMSDLKNPWRLRSGRGRESHEALTPLDGSSATLYVAVLLSLQKGLFHRSPLPNHILVVRKPCGFSLLCFFGRGLSCFLYPFLRQVPPPLCKELVEW